MIEGGKGVVKEDSGYRTKQSSDFSIVICIGKCPEISGLHNWGK